MTTAFEKLGLDPELDLLLEREVAVPPTLLWRAWTTPEYLKQWYCPAPWSVSHCELDVRPGGRFLTVMCSPEGEEHPSEGCFLEVVPEHKLVFTDALSAGYRPVAEPFMTGVVVMEATVTGTQYLAAAKHCDLDARKKHEDMGFLEGWGAALEQLVELTSKM